MSCHYFILLKMLAIKGGSVVTIKLGNYILKTTLTIA
jgi:hypothetical protein